MSNLILKGENTEIQATKATCTAETDFNTPNSILTAKGLEESYIYPIATQSTKLTAADGITLPNEIFNSFIETLCGGLIGSLLLKFISNKTTEVFGSLTIATLTCNYQWINNTQSEFSLLTALGENSFCKVSKIKTTDNNWRIEVQPIIGEIKAETEYTLSVKFYNP